MAAVIPAAASAWRTSRAITCSPPWSPCCRSDNARHGALPFAPVELFRALHDRAPEPAVLLQALAQRLPRVEAHEAKKISACQPDIGRRKIEGGDILDAPAARDRASQLRPVQVHQEEALALQAEVAKVQVTVVDAVLVQSPGDAGYLPQQLLLA